MPQANSTRRAISSPISVSISSTFSWFFFIRKISRSDLAASLCALLFGIHPMHVESVAWISGRKDLLYTFFYLLSSLSYLSYLEKKKGFATLRYSVACILFICSLLSKSSAVTLPAVLFLIDYYRVRKFSMKMVLDKIPFIVASIGIGLWAIKGQRDAGSLGGYAILHLFTRISIAGYSFMFYVFKFFIPIKLSACYPYPCVFVISALAVFSIASLCRCSRHGGGGISDDRRSSYSVSVFS